MVVHLISFSYEGVGKSPQSSSSLVVVRLGFVLDKQSFQLWIILCEKIIQIYACIGNHADKSHPQKHYLNINNSCLMLYFESVNSPSSCYIPQSQDNSNLKALEIIINYISLTFKHFISISFIIMKLMSIFFTPKQFKMHHINLIWIHLNHRFPFLWSKTHLHQINLRNMGWRE